MLSVEGLTAAYGTITVVKDVSVRIEPGHIVTLIGANGAGKTTLMRAIAGLHKPTAGRVTFHGEDITGLRAHRVIKKGLCLIPEGRQLFSNLSVMDNLMLGSLGNSEKLSKASIMARVEELMTVFPRIKERAYQLAGTLSGGEQQMLAIARGLMANPRYLMLDEPSLGLAPIIVEEVFSLIQKLNKTGVSIFLVEQNAFAALRISHRGYVLENGRVVKEGIAADLVNDEEIRYHYLGGKAG